MIISLLHPSRGRPEKARQAFDQWMEAASFFIDIKLQYILSIDSDDRCKDQYLEVFDNVSPMRTLCFGNKSVVEATNRAATRATGELLVYMSDDFTAPVHWDKSLAELYRPDPQLIKVDDGLQKFTAPVLTCPVMNRALYEKLGYFWHPDYLSMWVDVDLYYTCLPHMTLAPHIKFQHNHPASGQADETYKRSWANWNQGADVFNRRARENSWPYKAQRR